MNIFSIDKSVTKSPVNYEYETIITVPEESVLLDQIERHIVIMKKKKIRKVATQVSLRFLENVYIQFIRESIAQRT